MTVILSAALAALKSDDIITIYGPDSKRWLFEIDKNMDGTFVLSIAQKPNGIGYEDLDKSEHVFNRINELLAERKLELSQLEWEVW